MATPPKNKGPATALKRSAAQKKASAAAVARQEAQDLRELDKAAAQQLAQIVNLTIAGHSYAAIGASIGKSADEIEQMLTQSAGAYIRTQPALRVYVRNFINEKMTGLLDAVYTEATTPGHKEKLEHSAQALRILKEMAHLNGAAAPVQSEVKIEASDETVEALVASLSQGKGLSYDTDVFDLDEADVEEVHQAHEQTVRALEESSAAVEQDQPDDTVL